MIDTEKLKDLREIMADDFPDLIEIFFDDTQARFNNLQQLLKQTPVDNLAIRNEAHTLKGSSSNLFATELQQLLFKLEKMAFENHLEDRGDLMEQIENEITIVFRELIDFQE